MKTEDPDGRYDEIKRCLAKADHAFERAGVVRDEAERLRLIEVAESWLIRAERGLARITGRSVGEPHIAAAPRETRSFGAERSPASEAIWRRIPRT